MMIAKHIPMHAVKRSGFASLVRYLTDTQGKQERTGDVRLTNCIADDVELATWEVLNTQAMNTRALADKTYHLIVSFRDGEEPDTSSLASIEERICDALGFNGHQRVSVVHHDTDNRHLHIAINKIHPMRYTIHEPFHAYRTLARVCDTMEDEFGLCKDNHMPRKVGAENRATDMEHHTGIESLLGWIQCGCKAQMQQAQSWEQLHAILATNGLHLHPRANGLVITAQDGTSIKASSVGREFSKPKLEQRFGPFQGVPEQGAALKTGRRYEKRPLGLRPGTTKLYAQYQAAQAQVTIIRARERKRVRERKERRIEAAMRSVRLKRAALKLAKMPRQAKKLMYGALTRVLRDEISEIKRESREENMSISQKCRRRQWLDWLRHQAGSGHTDALTTLRRRKPTRGVDRDGINGIAHLQTPIPGRRHDSVTKQGTIIYQVGESAVRDEGDSLRVSRGAEQDAVHAALRMAVERFGKRLAVNGSNAFKEQIVIAATNAKLPIVFEDPALEQRRIELTNLAATQEHLIQERDMRSSLASAKEVLGLNARGVHVSNPGAPQKNERAAHARGRR
jgi:hypothetical protein